MLMTRQRRAHFVLVTQLHPNFKARKGNNQGRSRLHARLQVAGERLVWRNALGVARSVAWGYQRGRTAKCHLLSKAAAGYGISLQEKTTLIVALTRITTALTADLDRDFATGAPAYPPTVAATIISTA